MLAARKRSLVQIDEMLSYTDISSFMGAFRNVRNEEELIFQRAGTPGVYYPGTLKSMRFAFDLAWNQVSLTCEDAETARQILAVQILHHADRGEHTIQNLAAAAIDDLLALPGVCDRHHSSTRSPRVKKNVNQDFTHFRTLRQI